MNKKDELLKIINSIIYTIDKNFKAKTKKKIPYDNLHELVTYLNQLFEDFAELDAPLTSKIIRTKYIKILVLLSKIDKDEERIADYVAFLKNAHRIAAKDNLENFIIYYEWELPYKDKFYEPRMSILRGYCYYLNELHHKRVETVIANLPSGAGKTYLEKLGEAFGFGLEPSETVLSLCSNDTVVQGGSRTVIDIIKSKEFGDVFPKMRYSKDDKDFFLKETSGEWKLRDCRLLASYYADTVNSNVVGERASKLIHIDDLYADFSEALDEDLNVKFYNKFVTVWRKRFVQGKVPRIVITGTMWSPSDFMVKIIELLSRENKFEKDAKFPFCRISEDKKKVIIQVPAMDYETGESTCPELWTTEELEKERLSMDDYLWQCNFQQIPCSPQGLQFSYPNLKLYYEPLNNTSGYCKGHIDGTRTTGNDFFAFPIFQPIGEDDWALIDAMYTQTATTELYDEIIEKIIQHHIILLVIESNVDTGLKDELDKRLESMGIHWCEIINNYTTEKKSAKIERCKGIVKRKIWFPAKSLFPMVTQMGKFMNDFTSFNSGSGARNKHDDANDSVCSFADEIIEESLETNNVMPMFRPF